MKKAMVAVVALAVLGVAAFVLLNHENVQSATIAVSGMHCDNCAAEISTALHKLQGVQTAEVSFAAATAKVNYDARVTTREAIEKKIGELGYRTGSSDAATSTAPQHPGCTRGAAGTPDCCASPAKKSST